MAAVGATPAEAPISGEAREKIDAAVSKWKRAYDSQVFRKIVDSFATAAAISGKEDANKPAAKPVAKFRESDAVAQLDLTFIVDNTGT